MVLIGLEGEDISFVGEANITPESSGIMMPPSSFSLE